MFMIYDKSEIIGRFIWSDGYNSFAMALGSMEKKDLENIISSILIKIMASKSDKNIKLFNSPMAL